MCGIAGLLNFKGDSRKVMAAMNEHMKDRGPDSNGIWSDNDFPVTLGHQRLAIRDLTPGGAQPMLSHSERFVMVYNGEIYNIEELLDKLVKENFVKASDFRGTSDTEVLLEGIESIGLYETLSMCKGMFAIGLYDRKEKTLTLARDRVGEKPLYYGFINKDIFAFASDIGCFREIPEFNNDINREVLPTYFSHGYIPAPYSIYRDIYKLEPGTILTIRAPFEYFNPIANGDLDWYYSQDKASKDNTSDLISSEKGHFYTVYWSMKEKAYYGQTHLFKGSFEEAADELEKLMKSAIKGQMISDVPLGAFLSAGIDSSSIVSVMQSISSNKVKTFTIGMNEEGYNEATIAKEIAHILGTDHTEMYITDADAKAVIPKLSNMFGEPFADSSQIPTYLVSKMTREHVTVSLSGDAGDELFCGYTSYRSIERIWNKMGNIPYPLRKAVGKVVSASPLSKKEIINIKSHLLQAKSPSNLHMIEQDPWMLGLGIASPDEKISYGKDFKYAVNALKNADIETNHEVMLMDMTMYHPDDILTKVDRTSMAVSLESRVPFLDRDIVEFAWTLPISYLRDENVGKKVLRNVLYKYVPQSLMDRPKKGFSIPIDTWLKESELKGWAEDLLDKNKIRQEGFLNADVVESLWKGLLSGNEWKPQIWYILMFEQWLRG